MDTKRAYFWEWLHTAFVHAFGVADIVSSVLGFATPPLIRWTSLSKDEVIVSALGWEIPLTVLSLLFLVRIVLAPYWMHKSQAEKITAAEADRDEAKARLGIPKLKPNIDLAIQGNYGESGVKLFAVAGRIRNTGDYPSVAQMMSLEVTIDGVVHQGQWINIQKPFSFGGTDPSMGTLVYQPQDNLCQLAARFALGCGQMMTGFVAAVFPTAPTGDIGKFSIRWSFKDINDKECVDEVTMEVEDRFKNWVSIPGMNTSLRADEPKLTIQTTITSQALDYVLSDQPEASPPASPAAPPPPNPPQSSAPGA